MAARNGNKPASDLAVAYIIPRHPNLTLTFIDREILLLRKWGARLKVVSIRPAQGTLSVEQQAFLEENSYILPLSIPSFLVGNVQFLLRRPRIYVSTLLYLVTRRHPKLKLRFKTLLHFLEGVHAAHLLRDFGCLRVHAHFADRSAIVALVAGRLLAVPYSLTIHAGDDIFVQPVLLHEKLSEAKFVVTCTRSNKRYLAQTIDGELQDKIKCIYHGLDVSMYRRKAVNVGRRPTILAVGQLAERKGFAYLLKACRILKDQGYEMECRIVGAGPQGKALAEMIDQLSLRDTVTLCGALPHPEVVNEYERAEIFVLPAIIDSAGGRDGIPNVILEAMAVELPVVSTTISGIAEVVQDGKNGLLVPYADESALAEAIAALLDRPDERRRLGENGRKTVVEHFELERNVEQLLQEFLV